MFDAIRTMIVRGAPAIGIAGAHGVALAAMEIAAKTNDKEEFIEKLKQYAEYLKSSRPTAVNLMWAVDQQFELAKNSEKTVDETVKMLIENGIRLEQKNRRQRRKIGQKRRNNPYPLQRRRARNGRIRHSARGCALSVRKRQHNSGFCRRNPPQTTGRKNYDL